MEGVVPGRDDEYHPVRVLADEGRVQLRHLRERPRSQCRSHRPAPAQPPSPPCPPPPALPLPLPFPGQPRASAFTRFLSTCSSFIQWDRLFRVSLSSFLQRRISVKYASKDGWGQESRKHHPSTPSPSPPLPQETSPPSPSHEGLLSRNYEAEVAIASCNPQGISQSLKFYGNRHLARGKPQYLRSSPYLTACRAQRP